MCNKTKQNKTTSRNTIYENSVYQCQKKIHEKKCVCAFGAGDIVTTHLLCSLEMDGKPREGAEEIIQPNSTIVGRHKLV